MVAGRAAAAAPAFGRPDATAAQKSGGGDWDCRLFRSRCCSVVGMDRAPPSADAGRPSSRDSGGPRELERERRRVEEDEDGEGDLAFAFLECDRFGFFERSFRPTARPFDLSSLGMAARRKGKRHGERKNRNATQRESGSAFCRGSFLRTHDWLGRCVEVGSSQQLTSRI